MLCWPEWISWKVKLLSEHLSISNNQIDGRLIAAVSGRIDSSTAALFEAELNNLIVKAPSALIIDLAYVKYMSSAGLRVLLMIAKRCKAEHRPMILCCMLPSIREVFDISGFSAIFDIADTTEDAVKKAQS